MVDIYHNYIILLPSFCINVFVELEIVFEFPSKYCPGRNRDVMKTSLVGVQ